MTSDTIGVEGGTLVERDGYAGVTQITVAEEHHDLRHPSRHLPA